MFQTRACGLYSSCLCVYWLSLCGLAPHRLNRTRRSRLGLALYPVDHLLLPLYYITFEPLNLPPLFSLLSSILLYAMLCTSIIETEYTAAPLLLVPRV